MENKTKIKVLKRIHPSYKEFEKLNLMKKGGIGHIQPLEKYQYIYSSGNKRISLIRFLNYGDEGNNFWEIYCLEGKLFKDTERFETQTEAIKRIKSLL